MCFTTSANALGDANSRADSAALMSLPSIKSLELQPRVSVAIAPVKNYMRAPRPLPVQVRYLARLPVSNH